MRIPIVCLNERLSHYLELFREVFSVPQYKYFVTILLGLMLCQSGNQTLSGLLEQTDGQASLSGTSRFMGQAPWQAQDLAGKWQEQFRQEMSDAIIAEHNRLQHRQKKKKRGRPKKTVVTGYLIGDDSTMTKRRGKKMEGLGVHYSGSEKKVVTGHSLVQGLYVLLGRRCPLQPQMYRQRAVCEKESVPFLSKIDIMDNIIRTFEPASDTVTHVLLDSWYTCKRIWKTARDRGFLITSGLKCNRSLRIEDENGDKGWRWQRIDEYADSLFPEDWERVLWPSQQGKRWVYVHVVQTRIKKLYRCQLVITRGKLDGDDEEKTFYWASSDLEADTEVLIKHIAARWDIEVLFADTKEILGLDRYQLMDATAIQRFWTLVMLAYYYLDKERERIHQKSKKHATIGDAWKQVHASHMCHFIDWMFEEFKMGYESADLYEQLTRVSL